MKNMRLKALFIAVVLLMAAFCSNVYSSSDSESVILETSDDDMLDIIKSEIEEEKNSGAAAMLIDDDISSQIEIKSVYADGSSIVGILFEYTGSSSLTMTVDGEDFSVTDTPDSNGYIYYYFDNLTAEESYANVSFSDGSQSTNTQQVNLTQTVEGTDGDWIASSDGHTLYFYTGSDAEVEAPNFYNGKIVTGVGGYVSGGGYYNIVGNNKGTVESLTISDGIINIGDYAFFGMSKLSLVTMPSTIETIGGLSFYGTALNYCIDLPKNTKKIYSGAFYGTGISSVMFNDSLEMICSAAFYNCVDMSCGIDLPDNLYYIGASAFAYCTGLTDDLDLPDSLCYIGTNAFAYCSGFRGSLEIPGGVTDIGAGAFWGCSGFNGALVLDEGVETIGAMAFANSGAVMNISSVTLPATLKSIGYYAFQYCTKVTSIELNEGLETIGDGAFNHMTGITNDVFTIPSTVKTIGGDYNVDENTGYSAHVFYDMGQTETFTAFEVADGNDYFTAVDGVLYDKDKTRMIGYPRGKTETEFQLPEGVTQLDELSFSRASYLETIILPDSYVINVDMPDNVLNPDLNGLSAAIYANTGVKEIAVNDTNTNYKTENGILYSYDGTVLYYIPNKYSGEVTVADGTERIEKGCICAYNKANTNWIAITIPSSVEYIDADVLDFINTYFADYLTLADDNDYYRQETTGEVHAVGDADGDDTVSEADGALVLKYIIDTLTDEDEFYKAAADVNNDGTVDVRDAVQILNMVQE